MSSGMRFVVLAALLASGRPARAQSATAQDQAREQYDKGLTHYNLAEWDEAIAAFKKAYELSHAPGLLYNVAQAQRLKGDKELSFGERKMLDTARTLLIKEIAVATKSKEGKIEEKLDRIFAC